MKKKEVKNAFASGETKTFVIDRKESIEKMLDEIEGKRCPEKKVEKMLDEIDGKKKEGGDAK